MSDREIGCRECKLPLRHTVWFDKDVCECKRKKNQRSAKTRLDKFPCPVCQTMLSVSTDIGERVYLEKGYCFVHCYVCRETDVKFIAKKIKKTA